MSYAKSFTELIVYQKAKAVSKYAKPRPSTSLTNR